MKSFFKSSKNLFGNFRFFMVIEALETMILFFCLTSCTTSKLFDKSENQNFSKSENAIPYGKIEELSDFDLNIPEFFAENKSFARNASLSNDWSSKDELCVKFTFANKSLQENFAQENSSVFYCDDFLTQDWQNTVSILADFYNSTKTQIEICFGVKLEDFDSLFFSNQEILEPGENKNISFNFGNFFCDFSDDKNAESKLENKILRQKKTLYVIFKSPLKNGNLYLDNLRLVKK